MFLGKADNPGAVFRLARAWNAPLGAPTLSLRGAQARPLVTATALLELSREISLLAAARRPCAEDIRGRARGRLQPPFSIEQVLVACGVAVSW